MAVCYQCGTNNPDGAPRCSRCGNPLPVSYYSQADSRYEPLSVGAYIGVFLLGAVPLVGLIVYIVWACSDGVNKNLRHFAIAQLIMIAAGILIAVLSGSCLTAMISSIAEQYQNASALLPLL